MASRAFSNTDWNSRSVVVKAPLNWSSSFWAQNRNLESSSTTVAKVASSPTSRAGGSSAPRSRYQRVSAMRATERRLTVTEARRHPNCRS